MIEFEPLLDEKNIEDKDKNGPASSPKSEKPKPNVILIRRVALTTKKAVELLLAGKLQKQVCRFCLNITYPLSDLDQLMQINGRGALYKVTIRDIVGSVHRVKVSQDPNLPDKICEKCTDQALRAYLFAQQCEQAERSLNNCLDDMYEKLIKLDPIDNVKKRGRQKLNPNHNILYTEHCKVIDYAEPIRNLIHFSSVSLTEEPEIGPLECKKCWQVLPNIESLANHENMHPKTMWYNCRLCGKSIPKKYAMNRHIRMHVNAKQKKTVEKNPSFVCQDCGHTSYDYSLHLQHIEKHKFKMVLEHLVQRKMDKLCVVCLGKDNKMVDLSKLICLHGGYPELTGDRTMYDILGATVPEMRILQNHTGNKICQKCLDHSINCYVFINKAHYIRNRLETCITKMIDLLKDIEPTNKVFIEINDNCIMPITETYDENLLLNDEEIDEKNLKVEVLEDEFRQKVEDSSSDESDKKVVTKKIPKSNNLVNGFTVRKEDNLNEFLTFKKKDIVKKRKAKPTCPLCDKRFITNHFLNKHIAKHANRRSNCKFCGHSFKSKFNLHEHIKSVHLWKVATFSSCKICERTFRSEYKRLKHEKTHRRKQCELCAKTFSTQKYFNTHIQRHAFKLQKYRIRKVQTCSFCEKECSNDNTLSIHVNKVHLQIRPYSCDMCDRQFYTEINLKCHKKIHSMRSKETCEFCSKPLKCRSDLVVHVREHMGNKPYSCLVCPEAFYSEQKVKKHMKVWHGGAFFCKVCRKIFTNKKGLRNHINSAHSIF